MTISPEALAQAIDWTRIDDALISCARLLKTLCRDNIGDTAASELEYARSVIAALSEQKTVAWIGPQSWETLQRDGRVQTEIAKDEFMGPRRKRWVALYASPLPVRPITDEDAVRRFKLGSHVTKTKGSSWTGRVVGFYSTTLTPIGYAVESENEPGSVQIYPEAALAAASGALNQRAADLPV
jgi:R67 dihydrofolate reductase.